jgi:hypothetical protein
MLERLDPILKVACLVLAALVLYQFAAFVVAKDPLSELKIPAALASSAASKTQSAKTPSDVKETNSAPRQDTTKKETNVPPASKTTNSPSRAKSPGPRQEMGTKSPELPPAIQASVERITQSEILGPVIRPMPMALLGIACKEALLRSPHGQTDWVKEGGELGGIKLLQIGTNRVLIEHEGQKKELTVFSGFGSETLMPKGKETPK